MTLKRLLILPVLFFCFFAAGSTASATTKSVHHANKKQIRTKTARRLAGDGSDTERPVSIEILRDALYKPQKRKPSNSKAVSALKRASEALKAGKWLAAKAQVGGILQNTEYGDYARWISASASVQMARDALEKDHFTEAKNFAAPVTGVISPLASGTYPYSPLMRYAAPLMGQAEMIQGRAACHSKHWSDCKKLYENAFQRLTNSAETVLIQPEDIDAYASACLKSKTEICTAWIQRLAFSYSKNTPEFKALAERYPQYAEQMPRSNFPGRTTLSYRGADMDTVAFDAAMNLYLDQRYSEATDAFQKFADEYPRSVYRYRGKYWLGQALLKRRKDKEAKVVFQELHRASPLTYYGLLAAIEVQEEADLPLKKEAPLATASDPFLRPAEIVNLRRTQAFLNQKAYELAALELRDLKARDQLSSPFLVYLAMLHAEAHSYRGAFPILNDLVSRGYTDIFSGYALKIIFPTVHLPEIKKYALENLIDPVLVLSLMKQESAFDEGAVSSSGALGLMQLMPATAADTFADQKRAQLVYAEPNIRTGTKYLGQLLNRYQGNIVLALAAYNAGPGSVNKWIKAQPTRGMLEFVETIPFKETREYVSSIVRNYIWYSRILEPAKAKNLTLSFFWGNYGPQPKWEASPQPVSDESADSTDNSTDDSENDGQPGIGPSPTMAPDVGPASVTSSPSPTPSPSQSQ